MGLFDLFKKSKVSSTFPENELEKVLMKAADDASFRNEFYTKLLWSELYVLSAGHNEADAGVKVLEEDTTIQFATFETGQIPIFTSTNRIFDKGVVKHQVPFIAMKGQDLFKFTKGESFILNPYSDYGKELVPLEIEELLNGTIFNRSNEVTIEKNTPMQIRQLVKYPEGLLSALCELFKKRPIVRAAYIAEVRIKGDVNLPHLLIGLEIDGHLSEISKEAGPLAEKFLEKNEVVDFMQISDNGGASEYFLKKTKPFYLKK